jgi:hypothetical protein
MQSCNKQVDTKDKNGSRSPTPSFTDDVVGPTTTKGSVHGPVRVRVGVSNIIIGFAFHDQSNKAKPSPSVLLAERYLLSIIMMSCTLTRGMIRLDSIDHAA